MPRPSPVRDGLIQVFEREPGHALALEDLLGQLRSSGVEATFSSVFRAIARLEADGVVQQVALGDGRARYEVRGPHHEHVVCDGCGAVAAVPGCAVEKLATVVGEATGYVVAAHDLIFHGRCRRCTA